MKDQRDQQGQKRTDQEALYVKLPRSLKAALRRAAREEGSNMRAVLVRALRQDLSHYPQPPNQR